jgi:hypothetical protein
MSRGPFPVRGVTVIIDDIIYFGTYYVQDSVVYVQSEFGTKATKIVGSRAIAKLLLSDGARRRLGMMAGL